LAGGLAIALRRRGVAVTGTDDRQFSPMPERILAAGIPISDTWSASNLPPDTEAVIAGGLVGAENPEWTAAVERGLPVFNAAAFLEQFALASSRNTVIAGTKGKSTTSAMLAWIFRICGRPVDHLIGGAVRGEDWPLLRWEGNPDFILEGDEYPCGPEDPAPKLTRYHAHQLVVTNVSHDHPDIFPDPDEYREIFSRAADALPESGCCVLNADDPGACELARNARCPVLTVGFSRDASHQLSGFAPASGGSRFLLDGLKVRLVLPGTMNARNAALAIVAATRLGLPMKDAAAAVENFPGVSGRLEPFLRFGDSVFYTEDTAHPIAVAASLATLRQTHPGRRLLAIIFPTNTGGKVGHVQRDLPTSLTGADAALCLPVIELPEPEGGPFDSGQFHRDLAELGIEVLTAGTLQEMIDRAVAWHRDGDIIVGFKGIGPLIPWERLAAALGGKTKAS
jgi:UDP-N-acetylmuramate: L-alanyl-gamma-D-glutamyl-meso-diaminopimelate ligase